jgi:DNA polymerase (family 10)
MDSRTAAHVLSEIAALLELRAENRFKSRAYRGAAKAVLALDADDLAPYVRSGDLAKLRGIGKATLGVITDLVETGESQYLEQLRLNLPEGVLELMRVPGLGPEKIEQLHEALGINSLDDLEAAARDGRLATVKGFGAKTAERMVDAVAVARRSGTLVLFHRGYAEAARLLASVRRHPDVVRADVAGSVRRRSEVVRNIDIVAAVTTNPSEVAASFARVPGVADAKLGDGSAAIRYVDGTLLDLHCVSEDRFAVALWRATGSEAHLRQMSDALAARGFLVDDDGVLDRRGERVPLADENALYALLDIPTVPPEMREGDGELGRAAHGLPRLVTSADIRGVLHCHSTYSDGVATIADLADAAISRGWSYLGISDHSQSAFYAGGLGLPDIERQHDEIDELNAKLERFTILKGIEADIRPNGELDYDDETLDRFDYVIGSVHSQFKMSEEAMTARILTALENPRLTILGHPTGRLLLAREGYPVDVDAVIEQAARTRVAIELNADPRRHNLEWGYLRRAKERGVTIEIGPDAHSIPGLDNVVIGVGIARKAWLEADDILNARSADDVIAFARARRGATATRSARRDVRLVDYDPDADADIPF